MSDEDFTWLHEMKDKTTIVVPRGTWEKYRAWCIARGLEPPVLTEEDESRDPANLHDPKRKPPDDRLYSVEENP